jgi:hypothetical protein
MNETQAHIFEVYLLLIKWEALGALAILATGWLGQAVYWAHRRIFHG